MTSDSPMTPSLGRYGVWTRTQELSPGVAAEIESLGYAALWVGGSPSGDLADVEQILAATSSLVLATGIVNIWTDDAATVAASFHRLVDRFPDRFLLGIGAGHREALGEVYEKPYEALVRYLDALDDHDVPPDLRVLAALGPRVLRLAGDRAAGAHPYLTTPEHTRNAREILGPSALLAPEHKIVLSPDPAQARAIGRPPVEKPYLGLRNYVANLRRLGYTDEDLAGGGSDRLIDDLVAHGTAAQVADQVSAHLDAGADHVCVQVLPGPDDGMMTGLRKLATALF